MSTPDPRLKGPPPIPPELVRWLEETFPERCPDIDATDRQVWWYAGKRELVRLLTQHAKRQSP